MSNKVLVLVAASSLLTASCQSKAGTGALVGTGVGVGVGAIVGGPQGAIIGGASGAIVGGLIGAYLDESDQSKLKEQSPRTYRKLDDGDRLNVNDVINLHRADIKADKIIDLIDKTDSHFVLNKYQIDKMRQAGVPEKVIHYMMYDT